MRSVRRLIGSVTHCRSGSWPGNMSAFAGLGFSDEVLVATLECTRDVVREMLPEEVAGIAVLPVRAK